MMPGFSLILVAIMSLFAVTPSSAAFYAVTPSTAAPAASPVTSKVYITWYGWPDNDPPGNAIAYPKNGGFHARHNAAGGTGTYTDPITLASDNREIPVGTRVYVPFVKRYFIMEDQCVECQHDWAKSRKYHFDLWIGGKEMPVHTVLARENALTRSLATVIANPPAGLPVDSAPLI